MESHRTASPTSNEYFLTVNEIVLFISFEITPGFNVLDVRV